MDFEKELKKNIKDWLGKSRIRLQGQEKKLPEQQQKALLIQRALELGYLEGVQKTLAAHGIPTAVKSLKTINGQLKIVEAELADGQVVHASPNPFQDDVQAFIPESIMTPPSTSRQGTEPDWMNAQPGQVEDDELAFPQPAAQQKQERSGGLWGRKKQVPPAAEQAVPAQTAPVQTAPAEPEPIQSQPVTPSPEETAAQDPVPTEPPVPSEPVVREEEIQLPIDYAALAREASTVPADTAVAAETPAPSEPPAPTQPDLPEEMPEQEVPEQVIRTPVPPVPAAPVPTPTPTPSEALPQSQRAHTTRTVEEPAGPALRSFLQPKSVPPAKKNLAKRAQEQDYPTIGQALEELGVEFDLNDQMDPNLDIRLVRDGIISTITQYRARAMTHNLPFVDINVNPPNPNVLTLLDENTATTQRAFPYDLEGETFIVLTDTPSRASIIRNKVMERTNFTQVKLRITDPNSLNRLINESYTTQTASRELNEALEERQLSQNVVELEESNNAVNRYIHNIVLTGVNHNASDIHFEPSKHGLKIRFRIDKRLRELDTGPIGAGNASNVIRVIKNMSNMDVNNNRTPQDANFTIKLDDNHRVGLRVSTLPQYGGVEKVVIRLLKEASKIPEIEKLGLSERNLERFKRIIAQPDGIILITGPTGSGKSFTLYSALKRIATPERNTQTLENPVEYELPGLINQTQINENTGLTFEVALRSTMRQDPDIILLGEIRDERTASAAIAAANTGHLVLSTLHTNDASSAVQRLRNLRVEDYNIEPALRAVMAQRLVRQVCKECAEEVPTPESMRRVLGNQAELPATILKASNRPCPNCNNGYKGLIAIHELLEITPKIKEIISQGGTTDQILKAAESEGHQSLLVDGYLKVAAGLTTLEEIGNNVTQNIPESEAQPSEAHI